MKIYEIDKEIDSLLTDAVDPETGELLFSPEKLEELQMERDRKVENLALAVKNLAAEAKAIREEENALAARRKVLENRAKRAEEYLSFVLKGEKFQTPRVAVSYRTTQKVVPDAGFLAWAKRRGKRFLRVKEPEADKVAILAAIKNGETVPHTALVEEEKMILK